MDTIPLCTLRSISLTWNIYTCSSACNALAFYVLYMYIHANYMANTYWTCILKCINICTIKQIVCWKCFFLSQNAYTPQTVCVFISLENAIVFWIKIFLSECVSHCYQHGPWSLSIKKCPSIFSSHLYQKVLIVPMYHCSRQNGVKGHIESMII